MQGVGVRRKLTAKQKAERAANLPRLLDAAKRAVEKGWFIFPAVYGNKMPFKKSNAQKDARSGLSALEPWTKNKHPNPNVPLSAWQIWRNRQKREGEVRGEEERG